MNDGAHFYFKSVNMVENNRFYIIKLYRYTIHGRRCKIGLDTLRNVSLKQKRQCATQWRSVYYVSNGVSCIQRCFLLNHLINCSMRLQIHLSEFFPLYLFFLMNTKIC